MSPVKSNRSPEDKRRQQEREEEVFRRYQVRRHHDDQPDYRYSQPSAKGPQVMLAQHLFSFDETHPGIASQHFKRSNQQEAELQAERQMMEIRRRRAEQAGGKPRPRPSSIPSPRQLQQDVYRMANKRHAGRGTLKTIEREGANITAQSRAIQRQALEAIEASKRKTMRLSRSPSPVNMRAYPPVGYGSPNRQRSVSAEPQGGAGYGYGSDGETYDEVYTRATPTRAAPARPLSAPFSRSPPARAPYQPYQFHPHDLPQQLRQQQRLQDAYTAFPQQGLRGEDSELPYSALGSGQASGYASDQEAHELEADDAVLERDRAVQASRDPDRAGRSLADHLAYASGVRPQGDEHLGPALSEQEFRLATGIFDPQKYEEYNRQAAREAAYNSLTQEERDLLEAKAREAQELEALMRQTWQEQDSWMDQYRTRLGPYEGYGPAIRSDFNSAQGCP
ncbi:hypothetical protein DUNSADRAFT_17797 [Dunaliella salina]|uniref:Uncharacterized protein n=1 Tax=Dunaliella salina TaxID=3046 RepID=A0ABQ7G126_DUNSA|nr:hypothetical protein DUNSADRAFT_17797 [Dunaliella salina]|eukprot:KAF5828313.1 hypothetical protein DUNSADRAFT_17797 [Dunaliella salina]